MNVIVQKYYDDLINSFDFSISLSSDVNEKQAAGYHFNTDLSVEEHICDFESQFKDFCNRMV